MQTSIEMIKEEVKRLSNLYENRVPSVLLFETLFKAEEMHKQEIISAHGLKKIYADGVDHIVMTGEQYYQETFKKD
jgi:translation elongation factor P/translation initiation factor 5A